MSLMAAEFSQSSEHPQAVHSSCIPEDDLCFICLEGNLPSELLQRPCKCPRSVHLSCLARWQVHCGGKLEEHQCRFCNTFLPDWTTSLGSSTTSPAVKPVMAIKFKDQTYLLRVPPGPEGLYEFQCKARALLGFELDDKYDVQFTCHVPNTGETMCLHGLSSYGAATRCAAFTAAANKHAPSPHHSLADALSTDDTALHLSTLAHSVEQDSSLFVSAGADAWASDSTAQPAAAAHGESAIERLGLWQGVAVAAGSEEPWAVASSHVVRERSWTMHGHSTARAVSRGMQQLQLHLASHPAACLPVHAAPQGQQPRPRRSMWACVRALLLCAPQQSAHDERACP